MNRTRLFLVAAVVVVIVGAVVAFVLLGDGGSTGGNQVAQGDTSGVTTTAQQPMAELTPLPTITPIAFVEIVIAVQDIPRGVAIAPNAVALVPYPEEAAPNQSFTDPEDVIGRIARTDIYREQPILQNIIIDDLVGLGNVGSDAAAILPTNRVAIAVPMDRLTSVAYAIQPGDRVDIIVSMLFVDVDLNFQSIEPNLFQPYVPSPDNPEILNPSGDPFPGIFETRLIGGGRALLGATIPSETQRPRLSTQRTIQDALVIHVGDLPPDGRLFNAAATPTVVATVDTAAAAQQRTGAETPVLTATPSRPDIIVLAVSPQDAVAITWFIEGGIPLTFALRSASSTSLVQTDPVTLDYIMNRFRIALPDKLTYSIEPALRSIRQLQAGERISLRPAQGSTE